MAQIDAAGRVRIIPDPSPVPEAMCQARYPHANREGIPPGMHVNLAESAPNTPQANREILLLLCVLWVIHPHFPQALQASQNCFDKPRFAARNIGFSTSSGRVNYYQFLIFKSSSFYLLSGRWQAGHSPLAA